MPYRERTAAAMVKVADGGWLPLEQFNKFCSHIMHEKPKDLWLSTATGSVKTL